MNVTRKLLSELRRPERNVRMHTDKQLKEFRRSIEMFGQIRPIVVDEDGVILAGNGLYETLLSMGRTEADCYVVTGLTEAQKKKLMLADNRVFDLGVDDLSALDAFVLELKDDLDIPGYEEDLLRAMVMEADEAADTLSEYGTIDEERIEEIAAAVEDASVNADDNAPVAIEDVRSQEFEADDSEFTDEELSELAMMAVESAPQAERESEPASEPEPKRKKQFWEKWW